MVDNCTFKAYSIKIHSLSINLFTTYIYYVIKLDVLNKSLANEAFNFF